MDISGNLENIRQKIGQAAKASGRSVRDVELIAVSKGKSEEDVRAALEAGQKLFGENRMQEAKAKFASLRQQYPDLELHLIGPLQTNKVVDAVALFDVIQTLDRPKLAEALADAQKKTGRTLKFYIEVNIGSEPQKAGVTPEELEGFLKFCRNDCALAVEGLMCIPPQHHDPAPYFVRTKKLADTHRLSVLSMGMSADFETAVHCGATQVRVGSAIFGPRGTG